MQIYLARNNVQAGPYTLDELNRMLTNGEVITSDLMWHAGMEGWRTVGEMTHFSGIYRPNTTVNPTPASFGDNVDFRPNNDHQNNDRQNNENRRLTVAELYGKKETNNAQNTADNKPNDIWQGRHKTLTHTETGDMVLASIGTRFLATFINFLCIFLASFPLLQEINKLNPDPTQLNTKDISAYMNYTQTLVQKIDPTYANLTLLLLMGLFVVQMILIIKNGQSLGKLITGIKVIDAKTKQKPELATLIGARGIILAVIYMVAGIFNLNLILVMINYLMASFDKNKQGWHDKIAGTLVVKTKPKK